MLFPISSFAGSFEPEDLPRFVTVGHKEQRVGLEGSDGWFFPLLFTFWSWVGEKLGSLAAESGVKWLWEKLFRSKKDLGTSPKKSLGAGARSESRRIIMVMRRSSYFGREMRQAIEKTIRTRIPGASIEVLESSEDVDNQINDVVQARLSRPDAIVLFPTRDEPGLIDAVMDTIKAGIPVITVDRNLPSESFLSNGLLPPFHVASNFRCGGQMAAKMMLNKLRKKGNIAIIAGPSDAEVSRIRMLAFVEKILEGAPNVRIVYCRYTNWEEQEGKIRAKEILKLVKGSKIDRLHGIFCCSDSLAFGAEEACKGQDITIIGYDSVEKARQKIREGGIYGSVDVRIAGQATRLADELLTIFRENEEYLQRYHSHDFKSPNPLTRRNVN